MKDALTSQLITVAVVDPSWENARDVAEFQRILAAYPSLRVLGYSPLSAESFRAVAEFSRAGLDDLMLYSHDDTPERLRASIDVLHETPLITKMTESLRPSLDRLPVALAAVTAAMFRDPHQFQSVSEIASRANVTVARLYRSSHQAGLASPKRLLTAARLLRAYASLGDPGHSVHAVSIKLGFGHPRVFAAHAQEAFGLNPSRLRTHLSEDQVVDRLLRFVLPATS